MRRPILENIKQRLTLVEKMLTLLGERLAINKMSWFSQTQGVLWTYSRGYHPNAIISGGADKDYNIIVLKSNKGEIRHSLSGNDLGTTTQATMDRYLNTAKDSGILGKSYMNLSAPKFLQTLTNDLGVNHAVVIKLFPELTSVEQENKIAAGSFEVLPLSDKDGKTISEFALAVEKILRAEGFEKLCYGKLFSTASLGGQAIADYSVGTDTVRVSNKAKKGDEAIRVFIHELGHRLWYKFMTKEQQKAVQDKYKEVYNGAEITIGDTIFVNTKGGKVEVTVDAALNWGKDFKLKTVEKDPNGAHGYYQLSAKDLKTRAKKDDPQGQWKVTPYAGTVHTEFFPEVLSFALTDKKNNKELYDWIQQFKP